MMLNQRERRNPTGEKLNKSICNAFIETSQGFGEGHTLVSNRKLGNKNTNIRSKIGKYLKWFVL
jgi:hypothetical protein